MKLSRKSLRAALTFFIVFSCWGTKAVQAQITPANDGTGTKINRTSTQFDITGGTRSGSNLFHSFDQFGLNPGQTANFLSNPSIQNILSRVTGGNPSVINGLIQVTGGNANLYLMNPSGMIFGSGARLNVSGAFTATTASGIGFGNRWFNAIGNPNYAQLIGNPSEFSFTSGGSLFNAGTLSAKSIALLGGTVVNTGTIEAPGGNITIAAIPDQKIVRITQDGSLLSLDLPMQGNFKAQPLPELLTGGTISNATGATVENGIVKISGAEIPMDAGTAIVSGKVSVAGSATPGRIQVLGDKVGLVTAILDASSATNGGTVLIGGDYQGKGTVPNASRTTVMSDSVITANAGEIGKGGRVIVWSDQSTRFFGTVNAQGGKTGGDGGFVEVSGKENLNFQGAVYTNAFNGLNGTLLLDPKNITIANQANQRAAYISGPVWGSSGTASNTSAMNSVFGVGNWDNISLATATGSPFAVGTGNDYTFIYLDGSDSQATNLNTYLTANAAAINTWVQQGGRLFVNAAPNTGGNIALGFGVTLTYPNFVGTAVAVNPAHPIFNGPFTPVGTSFSGSSFAHATVSGVGLTPLIQNSTNPAQIVLGEATVGQGLALFGGMTTTNFHSPSPNAANLRSNIISYTTGVFPVATALFPNSPSASVTISPQQITTLTNAGTNVVLQANNDITVNNAVLSNNPTGNGGNLTMQAGRSILLNANLTTDNGSLILSANDTGAIAAQRDPGAAVITMALGTTINAGTGNVNISVGTFGTGGDITLQNIQGGAVTVNNTGTTGTVNLQAPIVATTVAGTTATTVNVANTAKIQNGVDIVAASGTVNAATGTYTEAVTIGKPLTLNGAGAVNTIVSGNNSLRVFDIASTGTVTLNGLTIANGRTNTSGAGILNNGNTTIQSSIIQNNVATGSSSDGGGIYNRNQLAINNTTIRNNTSGDDGGGIRNDGTLTVTNSTISGNTAQSASSPTSGGGAILNTIPATATIRNSTLSGNSANIGGAIRNDGTLTLTNSTISANTATDGGGVVNTVNPLNPSQFGRATLQNTIIAGNIDTSNNAPDAIAFVADSFTDQGNNLIGIGNTFNSSFNATTLRGTAANPLNPLLAPLANYGGTTQTHALLPGSPAIDAGTSTGTPAQDQRGQARFGTPDIGAFESQGFTIAATSGTSQSTTVNTAFANPLTATVTANNAIEPVAGGVVTYTAPTTGASIAPATQTATIDASGNAAITPTANTTVGTYPVSAASSGVTGTASFALTNNPDVPFSIITTGGTPQSATVNTNYAQALQVLVRDQFNNPVPNATVSFVVPSTGASGTLSVATATTDTSGNATVNLQANTIAGTYNSSGSVTGVTTPATFSLTNNPGVVTRFDLTGFPSPTIAGDTGSFTITAFDTFNNLATNYTGTVSFSSSDSRSTLPGASTLTNGSRTFNATLRTAGTQSLTGTDSSLSVSGTQTGITVNPAAPYFIGVSSGNNQTTIVNTPFASNLQATVYDFYNNVIPGVDVVFQIPVNGASGIFTGNSTLMTDATGSVSIPIRANTIAGQFTAQAQISAKNSLSEIPASFFLTNNPDAPFSINAIAGNAQSTTVNTAFANLIQVQVRDQFGNAIPKAIVSFNAPTSGASTQTPSATVNTDTDGIAGLLIAANTIAGQFKNNASVSGVSTAATFDLTNTADRPASITAISGNGQRTVVNTAFNQSLEVLVRDRFGNAVPKATVRFVSPTTGASSRPVSSTAITNTAGRTQVSINANTIAGTFNTSGTVDGLNDAAQFSLTNLVDVPAQAIAANANQKTPARRAFSKPLQVTILDQFGNPVPNSSVTFRLPDQGATGKFANELQNITVSTNANGIAQVRVIANDVRGDFVGTANVSGVTPAQFSLSNLSGFTLAEEVRLNQDFFGRRLPENHSLPIEQSPVLCAVRDRAETVDAYQGVPACANKISKRQDP